MKHCSYHRPPTGHLLIGAFFVIAGGSLIWTPAWAAPSRKPSSQREPESESASTRRGAKPPVVSAETSGRVQQPGSGTLRMAPINASPVTMQGMGTQIRPGGPERPTVAKIAAGQPQRQAARALALATLREPGGAALVARMAAADVGPRSEEAARILAKHVKVDLLRTLAWHSDASVRAGVARALPLRPRLARALLGTLLNDGNMRVLRAAVQAAAQVGSPAEVERLVYLAMRHDRSIQSSALRALAMQADVPAAKLTLIGALTNSSVSMRQDAIMAVGAARLDWALWFLERLSRDPDDTMRQRVAQALGRFPASDEILKVLSRLARDPEPRVRLEATRARVDLLRARRAARKATRLASKTGR